jgi:SUN family beta-glucosidase
MLTQDQGTESMTFPLTLNPGQTGYLANPDQSKYFFWQNKPTSAHYYINRQGVSEAEGCTWGDPNGDKGNWAPAIFGTSFDDIRSNEGYSSLKQNELNKDSPLDYSITFTGDGVVSPCSYKKKTDQYCRGNECWHNRDEGCTASLPLFSTFLKLTQN